MENVNIFNLTQFLQNFYNSCSFNKSNGDWILEMSSKPSKVPLSNLLQRKFIWRKLDGALSNVYSALLSSKCQDVKDDWQFQCYFTMISHCSSLVKRRNNISKKYAFISSFHLWSLSVCVLQRIYLNFWKACFIHSSFKWRNDRVLLFMNGFLHLLFLLANA